MMSVDKKQREIDFVNRTKYNLDLLIGFSNFDVTALINSCVGLFIYLKENHYAEIKDNLINKVLLDKLLDCVEKDKKGYAVVNNLKDFCRHLRNAITHGHFDFIEEKSTCVNEYNIIHSVWFEDYDQNGNMTAKITIPVETLKEFMYAFSDAMLQIIK